MKQQLLNQFLSGTIILLLAMSGLSAQETWVEMAPMPTARVGATSAVLDGKIFVIGGLIHRDSIAVDVVEVYDPELDLWETKNSFPVPVTSAGAESVNGTIYVFGGRTGFFSNKTEYQTVWSYNTSSDSWDEFGEIPTSPNGIPGSTTIGDVIFLIGGALNLVASDQNLSYDPIINAWTEHTSIEPARFNSSIVSKENKLYVMGGTNISSTYNIFQEYSIEDSSWTDLPSMPEKRFFAEAVAIQDKIFVMPGALAPITGGIDNRTFIYDMTKELWSIGENPVPAPTIGYALNLIGSPNSTDSIYLIGGATTDWWDNSGGPVVSNQVWKYSVVVGTSNLENEPKLVFEVNPNPLLDMASLRYEISSRGNVKLQVYNLNRQIIKIILEKEMEPGTFFVDVDTKEIPAGIYICSLQLNDDIINKKIIINR